MDVPLKMWRKKITFIEDFNKLCLCSLNRSFSAFIEYIFDWYSFIYFLNCALSIWIWLHKKKTKKKHPTLQSTWNCLKRDIVMHPWMCIAIEASQIHSGFFHASLPCHLCTDVMGFNILNWGIGRVKFH